MSESTRFHRGALTRTLAKSVVVASLVVAASLAHVPDAAATPVISIVPSSQNIILGDLFSLDFLIGAALGTQDDVIDLYAYQFGVTYDSTRLTAVGVTEGGFLGTAGSTVFFPGDFSTPGFIFFNAAALTGLVPGASGSGSLFSVQFQAVGTGLASASAVFDPANGDGLYDSVFNPITPVSVVGTSISIGPPVSSVPEPTTLLSCAIGSAMCLLLRSRRRRPDGAALH